MSENDKSATADFSKIPDAYPERRKRRSSQLIWLIPILAAIIGITLAVKSYLDRGPVITITFKNGEGIEAGKTKIRYKDVHIGLVKSINIAADRTHVIVSAELRKEAAPLLVEDTRFWVVSARISGGGVTGLGTLITGSYISVDAGASNQKKFDFKGLESPPAITLDEPGQEFVLHAADIGSLNISSPVFYRRMQVGEVTSYALDSDGKGVTLRIFIRSPYDKYVKTGTAFWHSSGVDLSIDASGVRVNSESMVSIMLGGISFQSIEDSAGTPSAPLNSSFRLFASREEAMKRQETVVENYLLVFKESVRGLQVGAPVDLRGVTVGEVSKINLELNPKNRAFAMHVEVMFYPERLRTRYRHNKTPDKQMTSQEFMNALVEHGFRAQLKSSNLLTGQLYVALDFFPKAAPAKINWSRKLPELPTVFGNMEQFQTLLMQIVQKIEKIPMEELSEDTLKAVRSLDATLKSADRLLGTVDSFIPELRSMMSDARTSLASARKALDETGTAMGSVTRTLAADSPLQSDLRETLNEIGRAAQSLRVLGEYLEQHPEALLSGKRGDN